MRLRLAFLLFLVTCSNSGSPGPPDPPDPADPPARPNILVLITDDQRADALREVMPITYRRIVQQGVEFTRAFATTPLCCPSRSSILTGLYARHHGVRHNSALLGPFTVAHRLRDAGYRTGHVGKFLNSWSGAPRVEYDFWVHHHGGYENPRLNVNGDNVTASGYVADVLRDHALAFLDQTAAEPTRPFLLFFNPNAPHLPATPAAQDAGRFAGHAAHRPPSYDEADVSDKPAWIQALPRLSAEQRAELDRTRQRQLESLVAVDRAIGALLDRLESQGRLGDTLVIFLSDNGYLWGEHRLTKKAVAYEESVRVPFALRYPRLVTAPRAESALVATIDIAPTIYELARVEGAGSVDGRSLVDLLGGPAGWRDALLLEAWPDEGGHDPDAPDRSPAWAAVRTDRHVYIETVGDRSELYDLTADPFQLENLAEDPDQASVVAALRARLHAF
ncbi:MAG: sulfatase [Gemmatimonadota bacterium]